MKGYSNGDYDNGEIKKGDELIIKIKDWPIVECEIVKTGYKTRYHQGNVIWNIFGLFYSKELTL